MLTIFRKIEEDNNNVGKELDTLQKKKIRFEKEEEF